MSDAKDDVEGLAMMSEEDMELFVDANADILIEEWEEARDQGWHDLVFIWLLEGENLRHVCLPRTAALEAFESEETSLPAESHVQLSQPAGDGKAWLIFIAGTWVASMRVECASVETPPELLN